MGFLTAIAWTAYVLSRENQLTLATLSDGRRAILYGALGLIALLIAGTDELFDSGAGTFAWVMLLAASVAAISGLERSEHLRLNRPSRGRRIVRLSA